MTFRLALILGSLLIPLVLAQCPGAPDGFWEEYNKEMKDAAHKQQHDHQHHDHHHQEKKEIPQQKKQAPRTQSIEDSKTDQEIVDQIEREAHGAFIGDSEDTFWFSEEFRVYLISGVFGFIVLLPFWLPVWAPLLSRFFGTKENAQLSSTKPEPTNVNRDMTGWFCEVNNQWPGQAAALQMKEILMHKKSLYQEILVFDSETWGRVLCLDGVIQITERDEMSYQEMLAHIPMFLHPKPVDVLVVGGGDGGVLREAAKHTSVKNLRICEIDQEVMNASKEFFPNQRTAFDDPRVTVKCGDAIEYCREQAALADQGSEEAHRYDVIIVDSSDPDGPAEGLFGAAFYANLHSMLRPGGVVASQGESLWLNLDLILSMKKECGSKFDLAEYASIQIPTYPAGQIGAFVCYKKSTENPLTTLKNPVRKVPEDMDLKFYTEELHKASFVLPKFAHDRIYSS